MKLIIIAIACLLLLPLTAHADEQNWQFVQSVGGLSVGVPTHGAEGWILPIQADVSGLKKITIQPTVINSGIVCEKVKAEVEESNIYLTLVTGIPGLFSKNAQCPSASLPPSTAPGKYTVYYRSQHKDEGIVFYRTKYETPVKLAEVLVGP